MTTADRDSIKSPIIILGAPRSGTTLLAKLLREHPDVALAMEPRMVWRYGNDRRSDSLRPEHATAKVINHIHYRLGRMVEEQGAIRLVEKTPSNSIRPAFVNEVFPDALFVHIVRDGWASVPSIHRMWGELGSGFNQRDRTRFIRRLTEAKKTQIPFYVREVIRRGLSGDRRESVQGPRLVGLEEVVDELGTLEATAIQWRSCVDHSSVFGRALARDRYLEMKLEEINREKINALLEFCRLPPSDEVINLLNSLYDTDRTDIQVKLTPAEQGRIAPYVVPANAWLGYPPRPLDS